MSTKSKILWVTDGTGWGWDIRANAISNILTQYEHHLMTLRYCPRTDLTLRVSELRPDVIVIFSPILVQFIPNAFADNTIVCLPGTRILD
ncbi:MAG: hypothetical protein M0R74_20150, partial [Dehalococcoidia bacterium]|nr:hypothetical protein [Dehalococcoidia bacterium]